MTTAPTGQEEIVLAVGAPAHGGHCVARPADDPTGRVVFVRHALPGEKVRAVMTQKTSKIWRADAVDVLEASPDRVAPRWAEAGAGGVGGGELSHVALPAQRTWKRWVLADCLRRIGGEEAAAAVAAVPSVAASGGAVAIEAMPSEARAEASEDPAVRALAGTGTRTRVSLDVDAEGRPAMHGFRSSDLVPVTALPLAVAAIQELGLTRTGKGSRWTRVLRPGARVEAVAPSAGEPVVVVDGEVRTAAAKRTDRRRVAEAVDASALGLGELRYSVHAEGFWQIHRDAPRTLVERVSRGVLGLGVEAPSAGAASSEVEAGAATGMRVLELYSGAGLLTVPLAALGARVTSLEGSERAVRDARRNLHAWPSAELHSGRVTPASVERLGDFEGKGTEAVVLDPPRQGAGRDVIRAVAGLDPRRIVLVACDPAALARDLGALVASGYAPTSMTALDMFPHTHHFETLVVLERA